MVKPELETTAVDTCKVCRKPIETGALKCTECGSYQDWSRLLLKYSGVGAAVLGVVPFFTIAISLWEVAFGKPSAQVETTLVSCQSSEIVAGLANVGDAAAILTDVGFSSSGTASTEEARTLHVDGLDSTGTAVLEPGGRVLLLHLTMTLGGLPSRFPGREAEGDACEYKVKLNFTGFGKMPEERSLTCSCA